MKTSITTGAAALVSAAFLTFRAIDLIAEYAYHRAPAVQPAPAARRRNATRPDGPISGCSPCKFSTLGKAALEQPLVTGRYWPAPGVDERQQFGWPGSRSGDW